MNRRGITKIFSVLSSSFLVLTMMVLLSSYSEAQSPKIPNQFVGKWAEYKNNVPGDFLAIKTDSIVWKRIDKLNKGEFEFKRSQFNIIEEGKKISFKAKNRYQFSKDSVAEGEMWVFLTREGDNIILETVQNKALSSGMVTQDTDKYEFKKAPK